MGGEAEKDRLKFKVYWSKQGRYVGNNSGKLGMNTMKLTKGMVRRESQHLTTLHLAAMTLEQHSLLCVSRGPPKP